MLRMSRSREMKNITVLPRDSVRIAKAFGLAYAYSYAPKILRLVYLLLRQRGNPPLRLRQIFDTLCDGFATHRFPFFCGTLIAGYHFGIGIIENVSNALFDGKRDLRRINILRVVLRFTPAFFAAWTSLGLYNRADSAIPKAKASSPSSLTDPRQQFRCARAKYGKSIDLTLFTAAYAIDYLIETGLAGKEKPNSATWRTMLQSLRLRDPVVFATSAGVIMWAWFYYPASLPKSYRDWIAQVAQVDQRLVETLRDARDGKFIYGQKDRKSKALEEMCTEYAWPSEWADPATTIPVPCEVVHMGTGRSCHWHAAVRFVKAFYFAFKMSLPLQIILRSRKPTRKAAWRAVVESTRSSSFLGAFVAAFYYGVCLSRSLLGPSLSWILEVPAIFWDSGACVAMGCVLSGWTVLLEKTKRQQEMAMFVLPRALSVFFPRYYGEKAFVIERLVFSCSIALLLTASSEGSGRVRGVLGKVLQAIVPRKTAMISK